MVNFKSVKSWANALLLKSFFLLLRCMFIKMGEMSQFNNIYKVCRNVITLIFAIAVAAACQKEEQMPQGGFPVKVTTTADNARPLAKTSVNNDLTINWTTGDQLLMVAQTANNGSAATTLSLKE